MTEEKPISIRLPVTREQRRRYMRAAGARKMKLLDWIYETLDKEAEVSVQLDRTGIRTTIKALNGPSASGPSPIPRQAEDRSETR